MAEIRLAVYTGSFDPPTNGHLDIIGRASKLSTELIVAVGQHPAKNSLFTVEERLDLLKSMCSTFANVRVEAFGGLAVDFARQVGARVLIRGLRSGTDFESELQMAQANSDLAPEVDTVFLPTRASTGYISGSRVREIASFRGDVSRYAPPQVCKALDRKFAERGRQ
jgi:pantetheine-phosphate adenylyltransferase